METREDSKALLRVNEVFTSYQGEGPMMGVPTRFIRLQGCNLKCSWCDSKDSILNGKDQGFQATLNELLDIVHMKDGDYSNVCITGGEPLLQQDVRQFGRLVSYCRDMELSVEIETNGTIKPNFADDDEVYWNCSPKLKHSGMKKKYKAEAIEKMNTYGATFKFVVDMKAKKPLKEVDKFAEKYYLYPRQVYLMAEGTFFEDVVNGTAKLMQMKHPYSVATRGHILFDVK